MQGRIIGAPVVGPLISHFVTALMQAHPFSQLR